MSRAFLARATFAFVAILWLGILLGVSFLATPVKFSAPSLSLPVALDVGRVTFALLAKLEWPLCVLLLAAALAEGHRGRIGTVLALGGLLAIQAGWLLPALDARVSLIIAGEAVAGSSHHLIYVAGEVAKAGTLLGISLLTLGDLRPSHRTTNAA